MNTTTNIILETMIENALTPTLHKSKNRSFHREQNLKHKAEDRKKRGWVRGADAYKKCMSKKGIGQDKKYKGEVCRSLIPSNSRCTKGWERIAGNREGFKFSYIYSVT